MSTGFTPEDEAILAKWLCAGCYGRHFIYGFFHGITDFNCMDISKTTTLIADLNGKQITLLSRSQSKHVQYNDEWFDPHGWVFNGPIDTSYASYWGNLAGGQSCWGERKIKEWLGEYSSDIRYINSIIYYADLRDDIFVYYTEEGSQSCFGSHNQPMGMQLGYAFWNGSEKASCQGVNIQDAIKIDLSMGLHKDKKELITLGNYTPYSATDSSSQSFSVAASEPFSNVFSMDIVDQSKPYDCQEGVFTNLVKPEQLWSYRNSWDGFGSYTNIDDYDESVWDANFNQTGVNYLPDGIHDYPHFVNIDPVPHGSWTVDATGNYFYSMITRDMRTFNKLNTTDPNSVTKLPGASIVFYPVGLI